MEFLTFMAAAIAIVSVILLVIAFTNRCDECGSLGHAFSSDKLPDYETGQAFVICKKCGAKTHKGTVSADGTVLWFSGGSGKFHDDGSYHGDSGGDGGDGGGGGE